MTDSPVAILGAIKGAVDQQAEALDAFKQANDERFEQLQERVEQIEDKGSRPGRTSNPQDEEHKELFEAWMRRPRDHQVNERLSNFQSAKAVTIATPADGGYAVPEEIGRQIEAKVLKLSPVRRLVKVSAQAPATSSAWSTCEELRVAGALRRAQPTRPAPRACARSRRPAASSTPTRRSATGRWKTSSSTWQAGCQTAWLRSSPSWKARRS